MSDSWNLKVQPTKPVKCRPGIAPLWSMQELGSRSQYDGVFMLFGERGQVLAQMVGCVVGWNGLPIDVYVYDPPLALRRHRHGRCLQLLQPAERWFKLHCEKPARTFDEARAYVEQLMAESLLEARSMD